MGCWSQVYGRFDGTPASLAAAAHLVEERRITHEHCVVLFFFLLSIDSSMRHWLLNAHEPAESQAQRQHALLQNVELVPGGRASLPKNCPCPFLGEHVALRSLAAHRAVSILTAIAHEGFFVSETDSECRLHVIFEKLKRLVLFA